MTKCDSYFEQEIIDPYLSDRRLVGRCNGTKECEICNCGGSCAKCDFYPEIREKAKQQSQKYRDKKELEFYRWWVTEHNLNTEATTAFEEYLKERGYNI